MKNGSEDAYNTGYGLHTNKTVTNIGDDGRTFDVNLESWYVGENPVDVATILDASGSMAWTVNTLIWVASLSTSNFSISFKLSVDQNTNGFNEATILYLTDGENSYRIFRGGDNSPNRLKISTSNGKTLMNANKATNSEPKEWKFTFDFDNNLLKIHTSTEKVQWVSEKDPTTGQKNYEVSLEGCPKFNLDNLKICIGGNTKEPTKTVDNIYVRDLTINNIEDETEKAVAAYPLQSEENGLKNTVNEENPPIFVDQAYNNGGEFGTKEIGTHLLDPVFDENNKYLNVKATSQNGAVNIDAVSELDDGFSISMKLSRNSKSLNASKQNIFYLGSSDTKSDYYQYFRSAVAGGYLGLANITQEDLSKNVPDQKDMVYYKGGMQSGKDNENVWYTNTLVFEKGPEDSSKYIVTPYIDGKPKYQDGGTTNFSINKIDVTDLVFLLCVTKKNGDNGSNQYLDDLYALDKEVVNAYFGDNTVSCEVGDDTTHALTYVNDAEGNFEKNADGSLKSIEIAQISNGEKRLGQNTNIGQRRGWYYVNSASDWKDIAGYLASGKQYIGIFTDDGLDGNFKDMAKDIATIPSELKYEDKADIIGEITDGNTNDVKYEAPKTERSIRFYVDSQNHLRCFVWSGATTKNKGDERTFCSLVYVKDEYTETPDVNDDKEPIVRRSGNATKYEELNYVVDPSKDGGMTVTDAFQKIFNDIQQPREDYNVQDYIDSRFDLVDKSDNVYHLSAGGEITVTNSKGEAVTGLTTFNGSYTSTVNDTNTVTVGNVIEPKEGKSTIGLAYTPRDSNMVNRTKCYNDKEDKEDKDYYDDGDGVGTGYLYYDDEKDMYYLRWEDQVIPMEDKVFDTAGGGRTLDIRLKAKYDFIGGNNILTNGNEAGEDLVYSDATIENMDKNPELYFADDKTSHTLHEKLQVLSGTDRKINAVDAGSVSQAVYGDGIDISSSGFPRTTVNVRLLKLDANNLNDVIYMGEVVSPTMMLFDLEDGYMTGSYYLVYLERYAYRLYGYDAAKTPLWSGSK